MNESLHRFLELITGWLDAASIPYMLAGSFASTLHGRPRSTQGVDLVIDPPQRSIRELVASIPPERGYVDLSTALAALRARDMFNVIDLDTGWKADLIVRKARAFSVREFERRRRTEWQRLSIYVASPEDVVLSKLEWCRLSGGSERQLADVAGVIAALGQELDVQYIEEWLEPLHIRAEWVQVNAE